MPFNLQYSKVNPQKIGKKNEQRVYNYHAFACVFYYIQGVSNQSELYSSTRKKL
jgi:hypothetical protein